MATWHKGETTHTYEAGAFKLCVWPLSGNNPFQAYIVMPKLGDSPILPYLRHLPTVKEAKKAVKQQLETFLREALDALTKENDSEAANPRVSRCEHDFPVCFKCPECN